MTINSPNHSAIAAPLTKPIYHFGLVLLTSFMLTACGGGGGSTPPIPPVVTPTPQDSTPVAQADNLSTDQGTAATIDLAANDSDLDDAPVSYSLETPPNQGEVNITADGTATYTPNQGYFGSDSFEYRVTDSDGDSATASVSSMAV